MSGYIGYIRVSTVKQGTKGVSLQEQRDAILRFAERNQFPITIWLEEMETAAKHGRPEFNQALKLLRGGKAKGIIIHKLDRGARNLRDWTAIGELSDQGVEIHFVNESLDLQSRGGRLSADIQAVVSADYIRNLKEETRKGIYGRLKQGLYPMPAGLGYRDSAPGQPKTVDPIAAPLIREAFELYASGRFNLRKLADEMFRLGLRSRTGRKVQHQPLQKILTNPFYMGVIRIKKTGETFAGAHEPIISTNLFEGVQAVIAGKTHRKGQKHQFTYRQLFTCEHCTHSLVPERQKGIVYYRCHMKDCPSATVPEWRIERAIIHELVRLEFSQEEKEYMRARLKILRQSWQSQQDTLTQGLRLQLDQMNSRQNKLTDAFLDEALDKASFEQRKTALLMERREIEERLHQTSDSAQTGPDHLEEVLELASHAYLLYCFASPDEKRDMLKTLSSNRSLNGKSLKITLKKHFQLVADRFRSCDGWASRDAGRDVAQVWDKLLPQLAVAVSTPVN